MVTAEQRRDDDDANANATATSVVGEKEPSLDRSESDDAKKPSSADAKGNDDAFVVSKHVSDDAVEEDNSVMTGKRIAVDESGGDVANGSSKVVDDGRSKKASRPEKTESVRRTTTKMTTRIAKLDNNQNLTRVGRPASVVVVRSSPLRRTTARPLQF